MTTRLRGALVLVLVLALIGPLALVGAQTGARSFPETGATAAGAFLQYWEANGGQDRFGAPVSGELTESGRTVQYFERAKMELTADAVVQLAPLGRDIYGQRYPAAVYTPAPVDPAGLPGGAGQIDPATGIAVPAIFLAGWQQLGGAESLGAPVSAVFREGARYVQYYEKGQLAHHPEAAGAPGEIQAGPIGRLAHGRAYAAPNPPAITTSIAIFGDYIQQVLGDKGSATALIAPGAEPHDFEPTPADAAAIASSRVFFANGLNLEEWLDDLIQNAGGQDLRVVTLSAGLPALGRDSLNPEFEQGNPHLWLDPTLAAAYVITIRDTLDELDPANSPAYDANAARYLAQLRDLDSAIFAEVAKIPDANRKFVTFHDAWPYFTARYGITNFPVHQADPEAEISAQEYAELVDLIRRENVRVIFGEAGFNPKTLRQLASDTGVRFVEDLYGDTLAPSGPFSTYVGMMQHDVSLMVDALQ